MYYLTRIYQMISPEDSGYRVVHSDFLSKHQSIIHRFRNEMDAIARLNELNEEYFESYPHIT